MPIELHVALVSLLPAFLVFVTPVVAVEPVSILAERISGHVHPSICRTSEDTLVVVYGRSTVLFSARSTDGGATWSKPSPIPTSEKRPDVIRRTPKWEVYPGTVDALPDDRVLVTWNFIADDRANDYYERALLFTTSTDDGRTWADQTLIGSVDGKHLGAVRHRVQPTPEGDWLLALRDGPPVLYDPDEGDLRSFPIHAPNGKQHAFQQILRTNRGTWLAMGTVLLQSVDEGNSWSEVEAFPATPDGRENAEGRFLTALHDGRVLVTWGVGRDNKGVRYNLSVDNGRTWSAERTRVLLPDTEVAARYYSARTIQIDDDHLGTVFMNRNGVHFVRVGLDLLNGVDRTSPGEPADRKPPTREP